MEAVYCMQFLKYLPKVTFKIRTMLRTLEPGTKLRQICAISYKNKCTCSLISDIARRHMNVEKDIFKSCGQTNKSNTICFDQLGHNVNESKQ